MIVLNDIRRYKALLKYVKNERSSLENEWGSTNTTNEHYEHLSFPSGEFVYNYEETRSFKLVSKSSYAIISRNSEHFLASNKGFGGTSNITNFNSFKTKELSTKGILRIIPLILNELCLLNTSCSKDNSIYKYSDSELDIMDLR